MKNSPRSNTPLGACRRAFAATCLFALLPLLPARCPAASDELGPGIWFDELKAPPPLSAADLGRLGHYTAAVLFHQGDKKPRLPAVLGKDRAPRVVFLSTSDGPNTAAVVLGAGRGIAAAIDQALSRARARKLGNAGGGALRIDIVERAEPMGMVARGKALAIEPSLDGIAFSRRSGIAFLPGQLTAHRLIDEKKRLRPDRIVRYIVRHAPELPGPAWLRQASAVELFRFRAESFLIEGSSVVPLFRDHRTFDEVSAADLLDAARQGADYLVRAVRKNGKFIYAYNPGRDRASRSYNIVRHAGTVYAMLEVYEVTHDDALRKAAEHAIAYLLHFTRPCPAHLDTYVCIVTHGSVKLGGNALAAVALAKYTEVTHDRRYLATARGLGRWIQSVQADYGQFLVHKQRYPSGRPTGTVSKYYPGEALLALLRLYGVDPDPTWLDAAERGARYLIDVRDAGLKDDELNHDHWLLYALDELYRRRPDPAFRRHALRIAHAIVHSQNLDPHYPDWLGSYYRPPRSTPTATRTEGLVAAYRLARYVQDGKAAEAIMQAARRGVRFQLQTQFRPESAWWLQNPRRAMGGFHASLTSLDIRIDYVQHNISALLGLRSILRETGAEKRSAGATTRIR